MPNQTNAKPNLCQTRFLVTAVVAGKGHGGSAGPGRNRNRFGTKFYRVKPAELATLKYCRENMTIFSGHKVVCYCNITKLLW